MIKYEYDNFLQLVKQIHQERKQSNCYRTLADDDSIDDIDFDSISSFDDLMLDFAKSEDKILIQRVNEFIDIVYSKAADCYESGKINLLNKLKQEGYVIKNNKKVVVSYALHDSLLGEYNEIIKDKEFKDLIKELLIFYKVTKGQYTINVTQNNEVVLEVFMYWITQLGKKDNINVSYRFARWNNGTIDDTCTYSLPYKFINDNKSYRYSDFVRFEYYLPDRYSEKRMDEENQRVTVQKELHYVDRLNNISDIDELMDTVDNMEGHMFEQYCANLLSKNGYIDVEVTSGSRDQGIDIIAYKNRIKFGIQCKCYSSLVGNSSVQEANAGKMFYNCNVGVVLTNQFFTVSAEELAKSTGIVLWDRSELENLIVQANKKSLEQ